MIANAISLPINRINPPNISQMFETHAIISSQIMIMYALNFLVVRIVSRTALTVTKYPKPNYARQVIARWNFRKLLALTNQPKAMEPKTRSPSVTCKGMNLRQNFEPEEKR